MDFKLYSQRLAERNGENNEDCFEYKILPKPVFNHLKHILTHEIGGESPEIQLNEPKLDNFGRVYSAHYTGFYEDIAIKIVEDHGLDSFTPHVRYHRSNEVHMNHVLDFIKRHSGEDIVLDVLELIFRQIDDILPVIIQLENENENPYTYTKRSPAKDVIDILNKRLRQHQFGYRYEERQLIRVDSEFIHSEAVRPALTLLHASEFKEAHTLFLNAHRQLLNDELDSSLNSANKSLEATLKIIIKKMNWRMPDKETIAPLVDCVVDRGLFPKFMGVEFDALSKLLLKKGLPNIRNKQGSHAQVKDDQGVYKDGELHLHTCQFALNLAASHIVFLVECFHHQQSLS